MRKSKLQSRYFALSVFLATLMSLQQTMAISIPANKLNPDEQDLDLELWRGPYSQDDIYLLPHKLPHQNMPLSSLFRPGNVKFNNHKLAHSTTKKRFDFKDDYADLLADAEFETELRNMLGHDIKNINPENIYGNVRYPMKSFERTDKDVGIGSDIDENNAGRDDNIRADRPERGSNANQNTEDSVASINKRKTIHCDLSQVTLTMLLEYVKTGRMCGSRATPVRFGLGR